MGYRKGSDHLGLVAARSKVACGHAISADVGEEHVEGNVRGHLVTSAELELLVAELCEIGELPTHEVGSGLC